MCDTERISQLVVLLLWVDLWLSLGFLSWFAAAFYWAVLIFYCNGWAECWGESALSCILVAVTLSFFDECLRCLASMLSNSCATMRFVELHLNSGWGGLTCLWTSVAFGWFPLEFHWSGVELLLIHIADLRSRSVVFFSCQKKLEVVIMPYIVIWAWLPWSAGGAVLRPPIWAAWVRPWPPLRAPAFWKTNMALRGPAR